MKRPVLLLLVLFSWSPTFAQIPNWSEHIAPVFYTHCTTCHRSGGIAPFSLITYQDAVDNSNHLDSQVINHKMPPWPPNEAYSHLAFERILSQRQIDDIVDWMNNGMPEGDTSLAPDPPVYTGIAEISNPDLVSQIPTYTVNTPGGDLYRCFVIPSGLVNDRYITKLEAIPGDRSIVHHILIYEDTSSTPLTLDAQDPGPGYTGFGGTGSLYSKLIGVWVPGQQPYSLPNGMGILLHQHTNIVLQVHYPQGAINLVDSTQIRFVLSSTPLREVSIAPVLNHYQLDNGPLIIPANTTRTFTAHYTLTAPVTAVSVGPHMHLIGQSIRSWAITPASDTVPFIDIPDWDFHWQGMYPFPRLIHLPTGTTLYSTAFYNNTNSNPENPNDPPQLVTLGEATTDEMMLIYFSYTYYLPGDENIVVDSSTILTSVPDLNYDNIVSSAQLYDPSPNPARNYFTAAYFLPRISNTKFVLSDMNGKQVWIKPAVQKEAAGFQSIIVPVANLSKGMYTLSMEVDGLTRTKRVLID